MSRPRISVYYDVTSRVLRNSAGNPLRRESFPYITFRSRPIVNLTLVTDSSGTAYSSLVSTQTFEAVLDNVFASTSLMCKTNNSGINQAGDWGADGTADISLGQISIRLNAYTTSFQTKISSYRELPSTSLELTVKAADNTIDSVFNFSFRAFGLMNDSGQIPAIITDNGEWFTDAATGKQCFRMFNEDGELLETLCPPGVEGVE